MNGGMRNQIAASLTGAVRRIVCNRRWLAASLVLLSFLLVAAVYAVLRIAFRGRPYQNVELASVVSFILTVLTSNYLLKSVKLKVSRMLTSEDPAEIPVLLHFVEIPRLLVPSPVPSTSGISFDQTVLLGTLTRLFTRRTASPQRILTNGDCAKLCVC